MLFNLGLDSQVNIFMQQCLFQFIYSFYTRAHLFQRVNGHKHSDVKKGRGKLECLIYEMLLIKEKRPNLNTQEDPIREKVFNKLTLFFTFL